jgi:hypothetical protein
MPKMNIADSAMQKYLDYIKADYAATVSFLPRSAPRSNDPFVQDMIAKFNNDISYKVSPKYIKVVKNGSVHSFVVNDLNNKFPLGSILKAASWKAPALNFKRGCVLSENFSGVSWTGA